MYCDCEKEEFTKDQVWMWKGGKVEESKAAKKKKKGKQKIPLDFGLNMELRFKQSI